MAYRAGVYANPRQDTDYGAYLRARNPHTSLASVAGRQVQTAKTWADALAAMDWRNRNVGNALGAVSAFNQAAPSIFTPGVSTGLASPWGTQPFAQPPAGTVGTTSSAYNPYQTISNIKNPEIAAALNEVLGLTRNLSTDVNRNPLVLRTNVKDQGQEARVASLAGELGGQQAANRQTLKDFVTKFQAAGPEAQRFADEEINAIGGYYADANEPGSVIGKLNDLLQQRRVAVAGSAGRALDRLGGAIKSRRMLGGDSSYLAQLGARTGADILANEERALADRAREDYLRVLEGQTGLAGRRTALQDAMLTRDLFPIDASNRLASAELGQVGQIGALQDANRLYNLDSPESLLARRLGLVGDVSRLDLANTFYGLRKPYEPDFSGYYNPAGYMPYSLPPEYGAAGYEGLPDYSSLINAYRRGIPTAPAESRSAYGRSPGGQFYGYSVGDQGEYNVTDAYPYSSPILGGRPNPLYYPDYGTALVPEGYYDYAPQVPEGYYE